LRGDGRAGGRGDGGGFKRGEEEGRYWGSALAPGGVGGEIGGGGWGLTHHTPDAQTSYLQQQLVTLNQEKQYMESRFTRLTSKGPLKTGEERREKLDLERRLDQVAKQIASLRREVRRLEGNSLNPKP
jgi:hypothetical protein